MIKKLFNISMLCVICINFGVIVDAEEVEYTYVDEGSKRPDGPCPHYLGNHKAYNLGMAKIAGDGLNYVYGCYYCECGYFILCFGYPETGGPISYYAFQDDVKMIGCFGGIMLFELLDGVNIRYTSNNYISGTTFYDTNSYGTVITCGDLYCMLNN